MSGARLDDNDDDDDLRGGSHDAEVINVPDAGLTNERDAGGGFQIVETDDDFRPLSGPGSAPRQELSNDDGSTDDGTGTESQRRNRQRTRRENQRRQAEETNRIIREQQAVIERLSAEANESRQFRETVTGRLSEQDQNRFNSQITDVDRQIAEAARATDAAIDAASEAMATGDTEAHKRAMRDHSKAIARGFELDREKARLELQRQTQATAQQDDPRQRQQDDRRQQQPQRQRQPDPEVVQQANDFRGRHPWIITDPGRADLDSKIAMIIDHEVAAEYDPRDPDYWEELEARLKEKLPHRFNTRQRQDRDQGRPIRQQQQIPETRRGPMVGGGGGNGTQNGGGRRQLLLSPERKQAMIQVGALEADGRTIGNRTKFDRLASEYAKFDRENSVAAR